MDTLPEMEFFSGKDLIPHHCNAPQIGERGLPLSHWLKDRRPPFLTNQVGACDL